MHKLVLTHTIFLASLHLLFEYLKYNGARFLPKPTVARCAEGAYQIFKNLITQNSILISSRFRESNSEKAIVKSTTFFKD